MTTDIKILRFSELIDMIKKNRTSIWRDIHNGDFVTPIPIGRRASGFIEHEVQTLLAARSLGMKDDEIKEIVKKLLAKRKENGNRLLQEMTA